MANLFDNSPAVNYSDAIPATNGKLTEGLEAFDTTEPAPEFEPLPPGIYLARVLRGEYTTTRAGADAYRMRFEITEGPHVGKTVVRIWTFSARAMPYVKRDLTRLGLTSAAKLLEPFPPPGREYHVRLWIALQRSDDGTGFNDVRRIALVRVAESPAVAYMLPPKGSEGGPK
jgi:hypothetical protein